MTLHFQKVAKIYLKCSVTACAQTNPSREPCHPRFRMSLSRHVVVLLLLAIAAAALPQRERMPVRPEPTRRVNELEKLYEQRGVNAAEFEKELREVEKAFVGVNPSPQSLRLRPKDLQDWELQKPQHGLIDLRLAPDNIWHAQKRLSKLGYLDPKADVDGRMGPRTRQGLVKFQTERGLKPTGAFDFATQNALDNKPIKWITEDPLRAKGEDKSLFLRLENLKLNLSARYRLVDSAGHVLFAGDDQSELATKLNESLSGGDTHSVYVEMKDFSEDKAEALAASLRMQQHQIDPSVSIGVLPHFSQNPGLRETLFTPGIRLERSPGTIEEINSGTDTVKFQSELGLRVQVKSQFRSLTVRVVASTREFIVEVLELVQRLVPMVQRRVPQGNSDEKRALAGLVEEVRKEMKKRHKGLTNDQLRIDLVDQFGKIQLGKLRRRPRFAWS
jgi:hypothetical protein